MINSLGPLKEIHNDIYLGGDLDRHALSVMHSLDRIDRLFLDGKKGVSSDLVENFFEEAKSVLRELRSHQKNYRELLEQEIDALILGQWGELEDWTKKRKEFFLVSKSDGFKNTQVFQEHYGIKEMKDKMDEGKNFTLSFEVFARSMVKTGDLAWVFYNNVTSKKRLGTHVIDVIDTITDSDGHIVFIVGRNSWGTSRGYKGGVMFLHHSSFPRITRMSYSNPATIELKEDCISLLRSNFQNE